MKKTKIVRDGLCERYDSKGRITARWFQKEGFKHGEFKTFYVNDQLNEHVFYEKGHMNGAYVKKYRTGELEKTVSNYNNGRVDGTETTFYKNGKREKTVKYINGFLHGVYQTFYRNENKTVETEYRNDRQHGIRRKFFENGQLEYIERYKDSSKNGPYEIYREDGTMKESGDYSNSNRNGLIKFYNKDGILSRMSIAKLYGIAKLYSRETVYPFSRLEEVSKTMYQAWKNNDFETLKSLSVIEQIDIALESGWFMKPKQG